MVAKTIPSFVVLFFWTLIPASSLPAQVFLDFTNFQTRLDELAANAGVTNFNSVETDSIQAGIKTNLETMYSGFTGLAFTEVDPGGSRPDLVFGLEGGGLGVADHIDFLNRDVNDRARVFTAQFDFVLDEFSGSTDRSDQLDQLTAALSGTAAHELGHNLGLRHHDAFGDQTYEGTATNTGDEEDTHVMATGSTGLGESGRETIRTFSTHSKVKLAYAAETLAGGSLAPITESGEFGGTIASAFEVDFEAIPVANRFGEVIVGTLATDDDEDVFEVDLEAGSVFTIDVNNDYSSGFPSDALDTVVELLDSSGTVLFTNDDTSYGFSEFGDGTVRSTDSVLFNVGIATAGSYFVRLRSFNASDSGDYQLLLHTDMIAAVPEPAGAGMFLLGGLICLTRRRRSAG